MFYLSFVVWAFVEVYAFGTAHATGEKKNHILIW